MIDYEITVVLFGIRLVGLVPDVFASLAHSRVPSSYVTILPSLCSLSERQSRQYSSLLQVN